MVCQHTRANRARQSDAGAAHPLDLIGTTSSSVLAQLLTKKELKRAARELRALSPVAFAHRLLRGERKSAL
jgi:hypothetical protein